MCTIKSQLVWYAKATVATALVSRISSDVRYFISGYESFSSSNCTDALMLIQAQLKHRTTWCSLLTHVSNHFSAWISHSKIPAEFCWSIGQSHKLFLFRNKILRENIHCNCYCFVVWLGLVTFWLSLQLPLKFREGLMAAGIWSSHWHWPVNWEERWNLFWH